MACRQKTVQSSIKKALRGGDATPNIAGDDSVTVSPTDADKLPANKGNIAEDVRLPR